ncbi:hypothetical protein QZH56_00340 [Streptomyces olivoreticuli]|uniref:DUF6603 domain-containing protein n=1 Tax=Streptomyces olivoreticuli TaxID=68246 RepID=UPI00265A5A74|nr:DUF6603 domain-containing protein [Streptomyces olivoreticuli]WKK24182.1 hypothetical protein QZH56_00340 [Streptomyces olivoreticuli]
MYEPMEFKVSFEKDLLSTRFGASWNSGEDEGVSALAILEALGLVDDDDGLLVVLPEDLWPVARGAGLAYDSATKGIALAVGTGRVGVAAASVGGDARSYAAVVRGSMNMRLSDLPLVGTAVPPNADLALRGVAFVLASREWNQDQVQSANALLGLADPESLAVIPHLPAEGLKRGVLLALDWEMPGQVVPPMILPLTSQGSGGAVMVLAPDGSPGLSFNLGLRLGPVSVHRVTLGYVDGRVRVGFDASMAVGPVALTVLGLGVSVDPALRGRDALAEPAFGVESVVEGAQILLDKPPVRVSGGLVRRQDSRFAELITGGIAVEAKAFSLQAAGSYARSHEGWTSLFLFGEVSGRSGVALFGPPPFTVTGLSLGFGVNSTVRMPAIEEMGSFPLVARLDGGRPGASPEQILEQLQGEGWITPKQGQYWGMGGVLFTSFRFIESQALLLVEGGERWNVTLMGRTSLALPRGKSTPAARVNIDLLIAYRSEQNLLSLDAAIAAGSYILDPGFVLTGGIALRVWTGGKDHAGDFVLTAGGYHDRYKVPDHYPRPAPLGFSWSPGGSISATGRVYGAVTGNALMFGGRLALDYAAGGAIHLQAWMNAHVDVLVQWKPFYFDASLRVRVGAAATIKIWFVRVRVSVEVGVDLTVWGPPLGGRATVHLWFVSFTFGFGNDRSSPAGIGWDEFRIQLPAPAAVTLEHGLLADASPAETAARSAADQPDLVSRDGFTVTLTTTTPNTRITVNNNDYTHPVHGTPDYGRLPSARPMHEGEIAVEHHITITYNANGTDTDFTPDNDLEGENSNGWQTELITHNLPNALWGPLRADPLSEGPLLDGRPAGLRITVPPSRIGTITGPVTDTTLADEPLPDGNTPLRNANAQGPHPTTSIRTLQQITDPTTGITATTTHTRRTALHHNLYSHTPAPNPNPTAYATRAPDIHTHPPLTTT